jgi:hypothetical protein
MNQAAQLGPQTVKWWQDWRGECVAIVGAGPSAKREDVEQLRNRIHVIAVNESYKLAPWAEVLYACEFAWWNLHKGLDEFAGLKVAFDAIACNHYPALKRVYIENKAGNEMLFDRPGYIGAGGNSGFQAANLAAQFGAAGIILMGIDCNLEHGEHWHGRHPYHLNNPAPSNVRRWREAFDSAAGKLQALGVDVVNCSPISALKNYPKMTVGEALARWQL